MANTIKKAKKSKHNIKVTVIELNQPSDEAVEEFNRLFNKFAAKLSVEKVSSSEEILTA